MKKTIKLSLFLVLLATAAGAQSRSYSEEEIASKIWGMALRDVTSQALKLNDEETTKFWPVWDEYRAQRKKIAETKLRYIAEYADNYENITNAKAAEITMGLLKNEKALTSSKLKFFKKIKKKVSAVRAAQFIQVEASVDNEIRSFLTENLPFVPEPQN